LPVAERERFERIYHTASVNGYQKIPEPMRPWVERTFGAVERVEQQKIVKVTNRIVLEGALFNSLRASRPMETAGDLAADIAASRGDPFCRPESDTPASSTSTTRWRSASRRCWTISTSP